MGMWVRARSCPMCAPLGCSSGCESWSLLGWGPRGGTGAASADPAFAQQCAMRVAPVTTAHPFSALGTATAAATLPVRGRRTAGVGMRHGVRGVKHTSTPVNNSICSSDAQRQRKPAKHTATKPLECCAWSNGWMGGHTVAVDAGVPACNASSAMPPAHHAACACANAAPSNGPERNFEGIAER